MKGLLLTGLVLSRLALADGGWNTPADQLAFDSINEAIHDHSSAFYFNYTLEKDLFMNKQEKVPLNDNCTIKYFPIDASLFGQPVSSVTLKQGSQWFLVVDAFKAFGTATIVITHTDPSSDFRALIRCFLNENNPLTNLVQFRWALINHSDLCDSGKCAKSQWDKAYFLEKTF